MQPRGSSHLFAILCWIVVSAASSGGSALADATPPKIEEAIAQAASQSKPLVLEFYTDWCKPCKLFEQGTLPDARVQAALKDVVFVRYDAEAGPGIAAAARYKVSSYPTFLTIDRQGIERRRHGGVETGEAGVKQFLALISDSRPATLDEPELRARLKSKPNDPDVRLVAARWFAEHGSPAEALAHYDAVARHAGASAAARGEATGAAMRLRRIDQWKRQLVAEKIELARRSPATAGPTDLAIATIGSGLSTAEVGQLFAKVFATHTDASALNELVYVALAAGAKDEALAGANQMIAIRRDPSGLDTLAECHHARGDRASALRVEDEAIALAKGAPLDAGLAANRARFDRGTGEVDDVTTLRESIAQLWKRLERIDSMRADGGPPAGGPPAGAMAFFSAARKLGGEIGKACAAVAGASESAYARITLDPAGRITASVLLLEPNATPALRGCLTKALAKASLPPMSGSMMKAPMIAISFTP